MRAVKGGKSEGGEISEGRVRAARRGGRVRVSETGDA